MRSVWITVLSSFSWMSIVASDNLCQPNSNNEFIFSVNFHSPGRMGEFQVDGCNCNSPVLAVKRGETYTLVQDNITNWMHPLGLAYYPDGAHGFQLFAEVPELEYPTPQVCDQVQFSCNPGENVKQAPLYGIDGIHETYEDWNNGLTSGLDVYEPAFKVPQDQWKEQKYSVKITVPLESKTKEFFYFCHIHSGMSGLIRVTDPLENANGLAQKFDPKKYYKQADKFDANCGTSEVSEFHTKKDSFCPGQNFLCETRHNKDFSECMEAIGCKMNYEMRVEEDSNPLVVFMDQMIPHHVNAVNMARIALKHAEEAVGYDDEDLDVPGLLREIINKQNEQIQEMENWLKRHKDRKTVPQYCVPPQLHSGDSSCNRNTLTIVITLAFFVVNINMY
eukprot:GFUD01008802.1.p1 GENE.GFUD01008802.1~~GFUD01008802.1.p1  ORF type:complete len:391 (-),score=82.88 GFUD01008802.1:147-1319(-)